MNELKEKMLERIKSGEVAMRPRWHFVLKMVLAVTGMLLLAVALVYLVSFMGFALRETGIMFMPSFGFRGLMFFLNSTPLFLVGLVVVFVVTLELLVRKYAFGYRNSLLYSVVAILTMILLGSLIVMQTPMHDRFRTLNDEGHLPLVGEIYEHYVAKRPEGLLVGTITEIDYDQDRWVVATNDAPIEVYLNRRTKLPPGHTFTVGEEVMILAQPDLDADTLYAVGVRPAQGNRQGTPPPLVVPISDQEVPEGTY